jgi:hypothetical protein
LSRSYGIGLEALLLSFYNYPYYQSEEDQEAAKKEIE